MLAIRLMQLFSDNKDDFTKITAILGLYFQIRDDYINLNSKDVGKIFVVQQQQKFVVDFKAVWTSHEENAPKLLPSQVRTNEKRPGFCMFAYISKTVNSSQKVVTHKIGGNKIS